MHQANGIFQSDVDVGSRGFAGFGFLRFMLENTASNAIVHGGGECAGVCVISTTLLIDICILSLPTNVKVFSCILLDAIHISQC